MTMLKKGFMLIAAALLIAALLVGCTASPEVPSAEAGEATPQEAEPAAEPAVEAGPAAEPEESAPAVSPYDAILAQYAEAVQNNYYQDVEEEARDAAFGKDVALEWRINPQPVYYALVDLDENGQDELIIGAGDADYMACYDIFSSDGETAVRLFDLEFGYRTSFEVLADCGIDVSWSSSAFESGDDFYRVSGTEAELVTSLWMTVDEEQPDTLVYMQDDVVISEVEYTELLEQQQAPGVLALNWQPLA